VDTGGTLLIPTQENMEGIMTVQFKRLFVLLYAVLSALTVQNAFAQESNPLDRIEFVQDGPLSQQLSMPLCEWYPKTTKPIGMVLAIHGLTLHGKRYDVLGKAFAAEGFYACAPDMRGFGRCYTDDKHVFDVNGESKKKVNYDKSFADIVALAQAMKRANPNVPLFAMGESLGTTMCIKLAAEHPELVNGLLLSGPTVKVHPLMVLHPDNMMAAGWAILVHPRFNMPTTGFVKNLVSNDPDIVEEMLSDPLCRKGLTIAELIKTRDFVKQTLSNASKIAPELPILVIQGSEDKCMVPQSITKLLRNIRSANQSVRWLHAHGHLLLETSYLRAATVDAIDVWIREQSPAHAQEVTAIKTEILQLGGKKTGD
jgi:alpha-beta hydrolase superfamily lysophospholipase